MLTPDVNFTGTYKIRLSGNKGDTVTFRFGERIYDDGESQPDDHGCRSDKAKRCVGPEHPILPGKPTVILSEKKKEAWFTPDFTYHTYRYIEISGLKISASN